jgi:uncharacterized membrane protein
LLNKKLGGTVTLEISKLLILFRLAVPPSKGEGLFYVIEQNNATRTIININKQAVKSKILPNVKLFAVLRITNITNTKMMRINKNKNTASGFRTRSIFPPFFCLGLFVGGPADIRGFFA